MNPATVVLGVLFILGGQPLANLFFINRFRSVADQNRVGYLRIRGPVAEHGSAKQAAVVVDKGTVLNLGFHENTAGDRAAAGGRAVARQQAISSRWISRLSLP